MAERSFPFKSDNGDRRYTVDDFLDYFFPLVTDGVFPVGNQLQVTPGSGMTVSLSAGRAQLNCGYRYTNPGPLTLTIDPADGVLNRIDRVVARWRRLERDIRAFVVKGTPASSPVAPAVTRNADVWELGLSTVSVPAGIASIQSGHISDTRLDPAVCGIVSSLITPDTSGWYAAWEAEFNAWFATARNTLGEDTAGELLNMVNNLAASDATQNAQIGALNSKIKTLTATLTAANQFTVTDTSVTSYTNKEIRCLVFFPAAASAPTLRFNALAYLPVVEYGTTPLKVKGPCFVEVYKPASESSFFGVSAGGGLALPDPIAAGYLISKVFFDPITKYSNMGLELIRTFTINKACTIKFVYLVYGDSLTGVYSTAVKRNGSIVTGGDFTNVQGGAYRTKEIDIACAAGDVITLWMSGSSNSYFVRNGWCYFAILWDDVSTLLGGIIS